ncbi:MAG: ParB/RepB/Spo0J family partition protein [Proteobacteria bacterium]|nr:ParB/RepB/Spo0J family partition protein [Pseudomonadota bacterium]
MKLEDTRPKRGDQSLGRGLAALFGEESEEESGFERLRQSRVVPVELLHPSRLQPRRNFSQEHMESLVESVRAKGIIQPIVVRRHPQKPDAYEIVAGERRWRAAQLAKLHDVPVIIKELSDRDSLEIALVENIQRRDLNPLEEAGGYRRLLEEFNHSQENLARSVGKSRSHVANMIRLLNLPDAVKDMLQDGALTAGHARALLNAGDAAGLAGQVVKRGLNVRQTERLVQRARHKGAEIKKPGPRAAPKDADIVALERHLSNTLGLKTAISFDGKGGTLSIHYQTLEQLDDVLRRLNQDPLATGRREEAPVDESAGAPPAGSAGGTSDDPSDEIIERMVEGPAEGLAAKPAKTAGAGDPGADRDESKPVPSAKSERQTRPQDRPAAFGPPRAVPSPKPRAEGLDKGAPKPAAPARLGGAIISPRRDDGGK